MRELILKTLRETVKAYPEIWDYLKDDAARVVIIDELHGWRDAILNDKIADVKHVPTGILAMVNQMLGYADCPDCVKTVFADVEAFLKQEDGNPKEWHEKLKPVYETYDVIDWDTIESDVTQEDIDEAVKRWDKLMPDYRGMLDAGLEVEG
jgi:hypothetical protein